MVFWKAKGRQPHRHRKPHGPQNTQDRREKLILRRFIRLLKRFLVSLHIHSNKPRPRRENKTTDNARNKTEPHSKTAAEGAEPDIPIADALDARRNDKRDALQDKSRP